MTLGRVGTVYSEYFGDNYEDTHSSSLGLVLNDPTEVKLCFGDSTSRGFQQNSQSQILPIGINNDKNETKPNQMVTNVYCDQGDIHPKYYYPLCLIMYFPLKRKKRDFCVFFQSL